MSDGIASVTVGGDELRSISAIRDEELVTAVREGDDRAFEALYARYRRRIVAFVHGMVHDHARAEDITQDVFLSALRRMRETDQAIAFKPWIYEIAKNASIDAFRRSRRAEMVSLDVEDGSARREVARLAAPGPTLDGAVAAKEQIATLFGAFRGLSDTHHEILVMRELEGLSYREIGDRLNLSGSSVESTLFRARRRLTEEYGDLSSGRRCERMRSVITTATTGPLTTRDATRLSRHLAHCHACRRETVLAGLDVESFARKPFRTRAAERIAGILPVPWLWGRFGRRDGGAPDFGTTLAQAAAAPGAEQVVGGWAKMVAAGVTLVLAGAGTGTAVKAGTAAVTGGSEIAGTSGSGSGSGAIVAPAGAHSSVAQQTTWRPAAERRQSAVAPAFGQEIPGASGTAPTPLASGERDAAGEPTMLMAAADRELGAPSPVRDFPAAVADGPGAAHHEPRAPGPGSAGLGPIASEEAVAPGHGGGTREKLTGVPSSTDVPARPPAGGARPASPAHQPAVAPVLPPAAGARLAGAAPDPAVHPPAGGGRPTGAPPDSGARGDGASDRGPAQGPPEGAAPPAGGAAPRPGGTVPDRRGTPGFATPGERVPPGASGAFGPLPAVGTPGAGSPAPVPVTGERPAPAAAGGPRSASAPGRAEAPSRAGGSAAGEGGQPPQATDPAARPGQAGDGAPRTEKDSIAPRRPDTGEAGRDRDPKEHKRPDDVLASPSPMPADGGQAGPPVPARAEDRTSRPSGDDAGGPAGDKGNRPPLAAEPAAPLPEPAQDKADGRSEPKDGPAGERPSEASSKVPTKDERPARETPAPAPPAPDRDASRPAPVAPAPRPVATAAPAPRPVATAAPTPRPVATAAPAPRPVATAAPTPRPVPAAPAPRPVATAAPAPRPVATAAPAPRPVATAAPTPHPVPAAPAPRPVATAAPAPRPVPTAAPAPRPVPTAAPTPRPVPAAPAPAEPAPRPAAAAPAPGRAATAPAPRPAATAPAPRPVPTAPAPATSAPRLAAPAAPAPRPLVTAPAPVPPTPGPSPKVSTRTATKPPAPTPPAPGASAAGPADKGREGRPSTGEPLTRSSDSSAPVAPPA